MLRLQLSHSQPRCASVLWSWSKTRGLSVLPQPGFSQGVPRGGRFGLPARLYASFLPDDAFFWQDLHSGLKYLLPPVLVDWFFEKYSVVKGSSVWHFEHIRVSNSYISALTFRNKAPTRAQKSSRVCCSGGNSHALETYDVVEKSTDSPTTSKPGTPLKWR